MQTPSKRTHRVAELIQTTLADLLKKSVHDPRLKNVTMTHVKLTSDFSTATLFFSLSEENEQSIKDAQNAFQKAAGFFRHQLSQQIELRHTPKLIFKYDQTAAHAERISHFLKGC